MDRVDPHQGETERPRKTALADMRFGPLAVAALDLARRTLDDLLEFPGSQMLLMMGIPCEIQVDATLQDQRLLDQRARAAFLTIVAMMSAVVDGLMPEQNLPALLVAIIAHRPLDGSDLQPVEIAPDVGIGMHRMDLHPIKQPRNLVMQGWETPQRTDLGIGKQRAARVVSIVVVAERDPEVKTRETFERLVRTGELVVKLRKDVQQVSLPVVTVANLDPVLVEVVAEHQRQLAALPLTLRDQYQEDLRVVIEDAGVVAPVEEAPPKVVNLMEAIRKSFDSVGTGKRTSKRKANVGPIASPETGDAAAASRAP